MIAANVACRVLFVVCCCVLFVSRVWVVLVAGVRWSLKVSLLVVCCDLMFVVRCCW